MPGGPESAYPRLKPIFEAVAAKYQGAPCVAYLGPRSAGNYVKMVHNGIEYGLMQLTGEAYQALSALAGLSNRDLSQVFDRWNKGRLQSYLVEISAAIFRTEDPLGPGQLIDAVLDKAKQKGTGKWTSQNGMDLGIPVPTIDVAVTMRAISALKPMRLKADAAYEKPEPVSVPAGELEALCERALYFAFIMAYAQGLHQLSEASREYGYHLNIGLVARIWRAGCIIRAGLLEDIAKAFSEEPVPEHLILSDRFIQEIGPCLPAVRKLLNLCISSGLPMPALSNCLAYFDALTTGRLPLNLIQAQRDYFGAHTFERTDREGTFHADWE
jgi:6-phosphogluconate dehydrogenase